MSAQQNSAAATNDTSADKGKAKSADAPQESGMDVDDSSSEEEVDEVCSLSFAFPFKLRTRKLTSKQTEPVGKLSPTSKYRAVCFAQTVGIQV